MRRLFQIGAFVVVLGLLVACGRDCSNGYASNDPSCIGTFQTNGYGPVMGGMNGMGWGGMGGMNGFGGYPGYMNGYGYPGNMNGYGYPNMNGGMGNGMNGMPPGYF